jgi:hypothetical protein
MPIGTTRQHSAELFDRRGNPVHGRTLTWTSSDPAILDIDAAGMASAMALGTATIGAATGQAQAGLRVRVRALPPVVRTDSAAPVVYNGATVHSTIDPNRVAAEYWYEYGTDSTFVISQTSPIELMPAGLTPVQRVVQLGGLLPLTRYFVRAWSRNAGGTTTGNHISFTTPAASQPPGPPSDFLIVTTKPFTQVTYSSARIAGGVMQGNRTASAWLEWSSSPSFGQFAASPAVTVPIGTAEFVYAYELTGLVAGNTYYVRAAARIPGGQTYYGNVESFTAASGSW